jgi:hypothetical protein
LRRRSATATDAARPDGAIFAMHRCRHSLAYALGAGWGFD